MTLGERAAQDGHMTTSDRKPRTRRNERGTYATGGAVDQDGHLPIYDCTTCNGEVVWATSARTGRKYLVNVSNGAQGTRFYMKHNVHKCGEAGAAEQATHDATQAAKVLTDAVATIQGAEQMYQEYVLREDGIARPFDCGRLTGFVRWFTTDTKVALALATLGLDGGTNETKGTT